MEESPSQLGAVFGFGLLHGFGLSMRLQQLPLGDDSMGMLLRIISFNVARMKSALVAFTFAATLFASTGARAGADASCHFHGSRPAAEATVIQCATEYKDKLVEGGKLEKSWQAISKVDKLEQVDGKRSKEWKLSFKNRAQRTRRRTRCISSTHCRATSSRRTTPDNSPKTAPWHGPAIRGVARPVGGHLVRREHADGSALRRRAG